MSLRARDPAEAEQLPSDGNAEAAGECGRRSDQSLQAGLLASGAGYLGVALLGGGSIVGPGGWAFLALAGAGMGFAVPALVAGATEALGPDRAGVAAAVNNTSRQVGGAIGVALIGDFVAVATSLAVSGASLLLGVAVALALV
jgi:MFS transporter, DHA2 family, methylenomycin A resistance protein